MENWEALSLDGQAHATTWPDGDGDLVRAHGHINRAEKKLEKKKGVKHCMVKIRFFLCVTTICKLNFVSLVDSVWGGGSNVASVIKGA